MSQRPHGSPRVDTRVRSLWSPGSSGNLGSRSLVLLLPFLLPFLLVLVAPTFAHAQSRMTGVVIDGDTGEPVAGAFLVLQADRPLVAESDGEGEFTIQGMTAGSYPLQVRHLGYQTVDRTIDVAGAGRVTRVTVELRRQTVSVTPIVVEVERRPTMGPLAAVYDRVDHQRLLGQGRFFEREDLENWGDNRVSNIIGSVAGVSVDRGRIILNSNCRGTPLYYLDGMPLQLGAETIDDWVHPSQIEVVEVYRRVSEIPGEFGGSAAQCGVISIWTRRGV